MHFYSIYIKPVALITNAQHGSAILENILPFGFFLRMRDNLTTYLLSKSGISNSLTYSTSKITEIAQYYFTKKIPTSILNWSSAYISDPNITIIINRLKQYSTYMWSQDKLTTVETSYRQHL